MVVNVVEGVMFVVSAKLCEFIRTQIRFFSECDCLLDLLAEVLE